MERMVKRNEEISGRGERKYRRKTIKIRGRQLTELEKEREGQ